MSTLLTPVKLAIYDTFARTTKAPTVFDIAKQLDAPVNQVQAAFDELHKQRLLVPEPGDKTRIRMAPPFSGIETSFRVIVGTRGEEKTYFAPCAWDSLGIPAALHKDAVVHAGDGHTGEAMTLVVRDGAPVPTPCVIHIAVPAAHWWDDIIYT
ncbi:MAG TPA: organomercurial lyase [Candidatus Krumholzibacteria bacterium]|nr:organomercurial lyase [Candidatus Krumholzibacteria bacterium]